MPLKDNAYPPYTPMASLGRELGIMFAFIGACLVTMAIYLLAWRAHQKRTQEQDLTRRKAFHNRAAQDADQRLFPPLASGAAVARLELGGQGVPVSEKMVDRYGVPLGRVELPVHGDEIRSLSFSGSVGGSGSVGKGIL